MRTRDVATYVSQDVTVRRWRDGTTGPVIVWFCVLAGLLIGSRAFFTEGVPAVGEFLPFPRSPRLLLDSFVSGWNGTGAGATEANPTGWASLAGFAPFTLFRMGLLQTLLTVGLLVAGVAGMWKFATIFPSTRARIGAFVVFAATPLIGGAMAGGRLTVLVVYAATPWIVHLLRRAAGLETADPESAAVDLTDGVVRITGAERARRVVVAGLVVALAAAFAPIAVPLTIVIAVCLALGTLLAFASWRVAAWFAIGGVGAALVGVVLNAPWVTTWSWAELVGAPPLGDPGRGLLALASFEIGPTDLAVLAVALFAPVVVAIALAKAWRLTWAVRAAVLVLVFGALAVLGDRGSLPFDVPEAGVLLVPVAFGVSVSAGALFAGFDLDVRDAGFGWRQPLGILAMIAIVVGVVPGILAVGDGRWSTPDTTLGRLMNAWLVDQPADGDYRVLLLGDSRVLPVPSTEYRDGLSWAIIDDGDLDVRDRWVAPSTPAGDIVTEALDQISSSSTLRAGLSAGATRDPLHRHPGVRRGELDHRRTDPRGRRAGRGAGRPARPVVGDRWIPDVGDLRERRLAPHGQPPRRGDRCGEPDGGDRSAAPGRSDRCHADHARRRPVRRRHRRRGCRGGAARRALRPQLGLVGRRHRRRGPAIVRHQHRLRRRRAGRRRAPVRHTDRAGAARRTAGRAVGRSDLHRLEDPRPPGAARAFVRRRRDADRVAPADSDAAAVVEVAP